MNIPTNTPMKLKTCKICREKFTPSKPLQSVCGFGCAIELGLRNKAKQASLECTKQRQERRKAKEKLKTRGDYLKECQAAFNKFVRLRDEGKPCVSCGTYSGQRHASHFYATSVRPNLRFDESNVHASCAQCNKWMHGNLIPYRVELLNRIGQEELDRLDADIEPKHYSIDDLKEIRAKYSKLARELEKQ